MYVSIFAYESSLVPASPFSHALVDGTMGRLPVCCTSVGPELVRTSIDDTVKSIMVQFDRSNHQIEMTSSQLLTWEPRSPTSSKRNSYCMFKNGAEDTKTDGKFYQNAAIAQKDAIEVHGRRLRGGKATKTETL